MTFYSRLAGICRAQFGLLLAFLIMATASGQACTIFVLTDTNRVLFCDNEDWSDFKTKIWFVPGQPGKNGCAYVGFSNGWEQGGFNTQGLAYAWVAGYKEKWDTDVKKKSVEGNSSARMLESCATVGEAITFYETYAESAFSYAKILVADRTGASVIIGARDGKLLVEKSNQCRGFGFGGRTLDKMLAQASEPTVTNGARILRACLQGGPYATKYATIFDFKSGDIFLFPVPSQDDGGQWKGAKLELAAELKKGPHSYDMSHIQLQPLVTNMGSCIPDEHHPIPDHEPKITEHVRALVQNIMDGASHRDDFTVPTWEAVSLRQKEMQSATKLFGPLVAMALLERSEADDLRSYRYEVKFEKNTLVMRFVFDKQNRIADLQTEESHWTE